jgi:hypothetical protein
VFLHFVLCFSFLLCSLIMCSLYVVRVFLSLTPVLCACTVVAYICFRYLLLFALPDLSSCSVLSVICSYLLFPFPVIFFFLFCFLFFFSPPVLFSSRCFCSKFSFFWCPPSPRITFTCALVRLSEALISASPPPSFYPFSSVYCSALHPYGIWAVFEACPWDNI